MMSSSSDSCRKLVAGNYDILVTDSPNTSATTLALKSVLTDFLERFSQLECELHLPEGGYSGEFKLLKEFSRLLKEDRSNLEEGELEFNLRKNRYKDILPFSHTRVVLKGDPLIPGSEYINANYIKGPSGFPKAYIACQGPLQCTLNDFWRMIWECNCSVIIMACNEYESGKPKCELYWPEQEETSQRYGNIQVTLVKARQICSDFLIRKFSVKLLQEKQTPRVASPQTQTQTATTTTTTTTATATATTNDSTTTTNDSNAPQQLILNAKTQAKQTVISSANLLLNNNNQIVETTHKEHLVASTTNLNLNQNKSSISIGNGNGNDKNNINTNTNTNDRLSSADQSDGSSSYTVLMERTICQFHYTTWPDHGAPDSVQPILELVRLVREVQPADDRPVLVHCSAGCGRTGTICCIDYVWGLLRRGKLEPNFDLYTIISEMRQQRMAMVQTLEQYILCHRAVAALFLNQLKLIDSHQYENLELNNDNDDERDGKRTKETNNNNHGTTRSFLAANNGGAANSGEEEEEDEDELESVFI